jgi:histone demethylase JARID1
MVDMANPKRFPTKRQKINTLQEGLGFDDGNSYTIAEYKRMADQFKEKWTQDYHDGAEQLTPEDISKDYWDLVETNNRPAQVDYGNDLDTNAYTSGFPLPTPTAQDAEAKAEMFSPEFYKTTGWNLNNLPTANGSLLKYLKAPVNGVNVPWLYVGMLFSSFCWHNEDNYFYSVNYSHFGAVKQWYGVAGADAGKFESVSMLVVVLFYVAPDHLISRSSSSSSGSSSIKMEVVIVVVVWFF